LPQALPRRRRQASPHLRTYPDRLRRLSRSRSEAAQEEL